jgi:hypothetical protein
LRVIAGRERGHTTPFLFIAKRKNFVGGAANLKSAGALQILAFEEDFFTGRLIK